MVGNDAGHRPALQPRTACALTPAPLPEGEGGRDYLLNSSPLLAGEGGSDLSARMRGNASALLTKAALSAHMID